MAFKHFYLLLLLYMITYQFDFDFTYINKIMESSDQDHTYLLSRATNQRTF